MGGFVDNVYLLVYSESMEDNYRTLRKTYDIYLR